MTRNDRPAEVRKLRARTPKWLDGQRLRELREADGLRQWQLAEQAGNDITQSKVSHWETGSWGCDLNALLAMAHVLKCQPADLMHDEGRAEFIKLTASLRAA